MRPDLDGHRGSSAPLTAVQTARYSQFARKRFGFYPSTLCSRRNFLARPVNLRRIMLLGNLRSRHCIHCRRSVSSLIMLCSCLEITFPKTGVYFLLNEVLAPDRGWVARAHSGPLSRRTSDRLSREPFSATRAGPLHCQGTSGHRPLRNRPETPKAGKKPANEGDSGLTADAFPNF